MAFATLAVRSLDFLLAMDVRRRPQPQSLYTFFFLPRFRPSAVRTLEGIWLGSFQAPRFRLAKKKLGSGLPPPKRAEVSPSSTESTGKFPVPALK
jgi:hypothetical protein